MICFVGLVVCILVGLWLFSSVCLPPALGVLGQLLGDSFVVVNSVARVSLLLLLFYFVTSLCCCSCLTGGFDVDLFYL